MMTREKVYFRFPVLIEYATPKDRKEAIRGARENLSNAPWWSVGSMCCYRPAKEHIKLIEAEEDSKP